MSDLIAHADAAVSGTIHGREDGGRGSDSPDKEEEHRVAGLTRNTD